MYFTCDWPPLETAELNVRLEPCDLCLDPGDLWLDTSDLCLDPGDLWLEASDLCFEAREGSRDADLK